MQMTSVVGARGEHIAREYLSSLGYKFYKKNVRLGHDEIDLITYDPCERMLVFVEVKSRSKDTSDFRPECNFTGFKKEKVLRAAGKWVTRHEYEGPYRVDLICVAARRVTDHFRGVGWE